VTNALSIVLRCSDTHMRRARYVLDTLFMARGIPVRYVAEPPSDQPWVLYAATGNVRPPVDRCVFIPHFPEAWDFPPGVPARHAGAVGGLAVMTDNKIADAAGPTTITFDLLANAFYFLSSWSERTKQAERTSRGLYSESVFSRLRVPQDIVDRYLEHVMMAVSSACAHAGAPSWPRHRWPENTEFGVVLSHDVDFIPYGLLDTMRQGAKTVLRHVVRERAAADALKAAIGLAKCVVQGRDAYGCVPEIIAREKQLRVKSSFQVAVGHRHAYDVNYHVEDENIRRYLRTIIEEGFELCLHGSYRSTEVAEWYIGEAETLARLLGRPIGSRQHFLSFDYETLFAAQEKAGIEYDMSMGFPDRAGPRAGFSYPYFPYCIAEDRPYNVLQISLFLMDVTLRSYMGLRGEAAWDAARHELDLLRRKGGFVSVVWHPIVFGGARDPGYDGLFWRLVEHVRGTSGLATDGRTINDHWRAHARAYASFTTGSP